MFERTLFPSRIVATTAMVVALLSPALLHAESLTVAWDPNPERDVAGYYVFIGTSPGIYTTTVDVGSATSFTFPDAAPGTTYFVSVAAYVPGPVVGPRAEEIRTTTEGAPHLVNPGDRSSSLGRAVTVTLVASDPNDDPITFGALGLPPGISLYPVTRTLSGTPLAAGQFNVAITAADDNANVTTQHFVWTVSVPDIAPPTVSIAGPTAGPTFRTSSAFATLTGTATDDVGVASVTWTSSTGTSGTAAGTADWSVIVPLVKGANRITITARDGAHKIATDVIDVTMATDLPPTLNILRPTALTSYSARGRTLTLAGSAADDGSVSSVSWSNDRGGSGTATGVTSWSASGIALQVGTNVVTVTARDNSGQTSTDTITVDWRPAPLALTSLTANKAAPLRVWSLVTFSAKATGGVEPYEYKWWLFDGTSWSVRQDWSTRATWRWVPERANPNSIVKVQVRSAGSGAEDPETGGTSATLAFPVRAR